MEFGAAGNLKVSAAATWPGLPRPQLDERKDSIAANPRSSPGVPGCFRSRRYFDWPKIPPEVHGKLGID